MTGFFLSTLLGLDHVRVMDAPPSISDAVPVMKALVVEGEV